MIKRNGATGKLPERAFANGFANDLVDEMKDLAEAFGLPFRTITKNGETYIGVILPRQEELDAITKHTLAVTGQVPDSAEVGYLDQVRR